MVSVTDDLLHPRCLRTDLAALDVHPRRLKTERIDLVHRSSNIDTGRRRFVKFGGSQSRVNAGGRTGRASGHCKRLADVSLSADFSEEDRVFW
jgi:hypothetical protein